MPSKPVDCSELEAAIARLALHIGSDPAVKGIDGVVEAMKADFPEIKREDVVGAINAASRTRAKDLTDAQKAARRIRAEAKSDKALRAKIDALDEHLKNATLPDGPAPRVDHASEAVKTLKQIRGDLDKAVKGSDPAVRKRLSEQVKALEDRLAKGVEAPLPRPDKVLSKEAERLAFERDKLRREINQKINALRPKSFFTRYALGPAAEGANLARNLVTGFDLGLSAVLRQGGFITLAHPVRAAKVIPHMLRASFSEQAAHRVMAGIDARPNAHLYARYGLELTHLDGPLNGMEEAVMSRVSQWLRTKMSRLPSSQRGYTVFLNKLRADSFDAMAETWGRRGEVTAEQGKAISNFINVATGRGKLAGKWKQAGPAMASALFAPRLAVSRFQLLLGQPMWHGPRGVRIQIAAEYARYAAGIAVVYTLGKLAGGEIETDRRSSDFGKLRFGNTRLDPLSGLSQAFVFMSRLQTGEKKSVTGRDKGKVKEADVWKVITQFGRSKLSPLAAAAVDITTRKDYLGRPTTAAGVAKNLTLPMQWRDTYTILKEHGLAGGSVLEAFNMAGASAQNFGDE